MIWDLKKVFSNEFNHAAKSVQLDFSNMTLNGLRIFKSPVGAHLVAKNCGGEVSVKLEVDVKVSTLCDRCLCDIEREYKYSFSHVLVDALGEDVPYDYLEAPNAKLDVYELIKDDVLLELPSKVLCDCSCRGMCPTCGENLNKGNCGCRKHTGDSRFEVLSELLKEKI